MSMTLKFISLRGLPPELLIHASNCLFESLSWIFTRYVKLKLTEIEPYIFLSKSAFLSYLKETWSFPLIQVKSTETAWTHFSPDTFNLYTSNFKIHPEFSHSSVHSITFRVLKDKHWHIKFSNLWMLMFWHSKWSQHFGCWHALSECPG